jgi:hypothetical protein
MHATLFFSNPAVTEQDGTAVTIVAFVLEVLGSNNDLDIDYPEVCFVIYEAQT